MKGDKTRPVQISGLRAYFAASYQLNDEQVEQMIRSSQQSLAETLAAVSGAVESAKHRDLAQSAHNLRGLLLNMGESGWAELARVIEVRAKNGEKAPYHAMTAEIVEGVRAVLEYFPATEKDPKTK